MLPDIPFSSSSLVRRPNFLAQLRVSVRRGSVRYKTTPRDLSV